MSATTAATASVLSQPARDPSVAASRGRRRRSADRVARVLAWLAAVLGLVFLASILVTLLIRGFGGLSLTVFTESTKGPGSNGGLLNAIVGTLIQTALGTVIGTPIGLMVGTYLAEYSGGSRFGNVVRFVSDILLSAPSILIGLFIYQFVVRPFGYSGWAGGLALAVIVIPIVVRTTEDMLRLIPTALREAAVALGAPKWKSIVFICYRAAFDGILTGALLAVARIAGETAPLLFTSFGNQDWSLDMAQPLASLPLTINKFYSGPPDWVELAWTGALLITFGVLLLNVIARYALRKKA